MKTVRGLCFHGFGASSVDMQALTEVVSQKCARHVEIEWALPNAPYDVQSLTAMPNSYAWFPDIDECAKITTPLFWNTLEHRHFLSLDKAVHELVHSYALMHESRPLLLMGFSQGTMVATQLALELLKSASPVFCLALFSGALVARTQWEKLRDEILPVRGSHTLPAVFVAHGSNDDTIEVSRGISLYEFWRDVCKDTQQKPVYHEDESQHEISAEALSHFCDFLIQCVS